MSCRYPDPSPPHLSEWDKVCSEPVWFPRRFSTESIVTLCAEPALFSDGDALWLQIIAVIERGCDTFPVCARFRLPYLRECSCRYRIRICDLSISRQNRICARVYPEKESGCFPFSRDRLPVFPETSGHYPYR